MYFKMKKPSPGYHLKERTMGNFLQSPPSADWMDVGEPMAEAGGMWLQGLRCGQR